MTSARTLLLAVIVSTVAAAAAFRGTAAAGEPQAAQAPVRARLLTGPEGGTYFALGKLLEAHPPAGVKIEASASDGSLGNLIMTSVGRTELAFVQADVLSFMRAQAEYAGPMHKVAIVLPLWREEIHLVVNRSAGIKALGDLKGKRLNIGVGASGSSLSAAVLLEAIGLGEDQVAISQLANDDALAAVRAGRIDAMLVTGGSPLPFLAELSESEGETIALLGFDRGTVEKLTKGKPYRVTVIPAGTYAWQAEVVPTVATLCLLVSRDAAAGELVRRVAAGILGSAAELSKAHPKWSEVDRDLARSLLAGGDLPFHPGAVKAIRDRD